MLCVYVDVFLVIAPAGPVREAAVKALTSLWEFGAERALTPETSLTFLGIYWFRRKNGDIFLTQERFTKELLAKHNMINCTPIKCITMEKPPEQVHIPTVEQLTELQSYAGAFNWLATRTRPDVAYYTSLFGTKCFKAEHLEPGACAQGAAVLGGDDRSRVDYEGRRK